ncbi:ATP-binding protein [Oleispirillum naphthae]|uniref:ATP-binding protein n=1 Tax=Oleispirillum naphthae TaxID=2838853 RepID=UPI00308224FF
MAENAQPEPGHARFSFKALLPKSLLGRSLMIILTPLILLQLVTATVFYDRHWGTITRRLAASVAGDAGVIVAYLRDHPGPAARAWIVSEARNRMQLDIVFADGEILRNLPSGDEEPSYGALAEALKENLAQPFQLAESDDEDNNVEIRIQLADSVLTVSSPKKRLSSFTIYLFLIWMIGTSLLLFGIATIFMNNQVRAVRRLAVAADSFGKGRDAPWFKPEGATEVRQAAQAFLVMRDRIKRQIDQRTEMLAGVSHDLRTPLTRMKLQLAMMGEDAAAADLKEDVEEMERMVEGYLAFARGEGREAMRPANISALVETVVGRFTRNGAPIDLHIERGLSLPLRPQAVERCIANLVSNAVRYGKHVAVRVGQRADAVEILVDDDGPGVPAEKRADVFRAFFRIDNSRNPETGGIGLGLTIARDVARSHGGDIQLADSPLGGLRVRLVLPL